jgi:predicted SnoaL-like aldol condensation-catalyzing enzyme
MSKIADGSVVTVSIHGKMGQVGNKQYSVTDIACGGYGTRVSQLEAIGMECQ